MTAEARCNEGLGPKPGGISVLVHPWVNEPVIVDLGEGPVVVTPSVAALETALAGLGDKQLQQLARRTPP